jgi:L-asparaginase/Glu-tRNA(Gln) amidotransferase subunit D
VNIQELKTKEYAGMRELFVISTGVTIAFAESPEEELAAMWEAESLGFSAEEVAWR